MASYTIVTVCILWWFAQCLCALRNRQKLQVFHKYTERHMKHFTQIFFFFDTTTHFVLVCLNMSLYYESVISKL